MEHTAQLPKKLLSLLLSLLMIFSACYAGVNGVYTVYAAQGDSKYSHAEVIEKINAALADGKSYSSSGDAFNFTGDNGKTLAAAECIFDYAVKTYRGGRADTASNNSGDTLLAAFLAEFKDEFSNADRGTQLATAVLNPAGTTVYGYENKRSTTGTATGQSDNWGGAGADASGKNVNLPAISAVDKTVTIKVDVDTFLQAYELIDDIPSSFLTEVSYTYAHTIGKHATVTSVKTNDNGCDDDTYDVSYSSDAWNYMSAKPVRTVVKNTTAKKYLKSVLKFFNEEVLAYSQEDLLAMSLSDLEYLDSQALDFQKMMNDNFSDATLAHFDVPKSEITAFIGRLAFAHKVVAAKSAIDTMDALVGSEYNVESYSQMSSLYNKVNYAYGVVTAIDVNTLNFIRDNYDEVEAKYDSINFTEAKAYIDTLLEIMTEQRLEETVNSMMAKYNQYDALLIRENVNVPSDPEVSSLLSSKNSWNALLGTYTSKAYYRTYYTAEIEAKWLSFAAKIDAVADVRGLKAEYQNYYNYFYPIIYTADINTHDSEFLMTLYEEMDTQLGNLTAKYNDIKTKYNETIANNIFTLNYEGKDDLLQNIVTNSSSAGKNEIKNVLVARTEQQIDNVQAYAGVTTVNFDNFAEIKSTISHFDYALYDFVTGYGWLSSDYVSKYSMVQTLLERYHAFSKAGDGGKSFFDEDFTFEEDGYYAIRYAGDYTVSTGEVDENGDAIVEQLGYPNDLVRDGADDNYYVTEQTLVDTIAKLDGFITSRDFGALLDFYNEEEDTYVGLKEYLNMMLGDMLYNDEMVNTLVGAIFPMICDMITNELVGAIGDLDGASVDANGVPWLDLGVVAKDAVSGLSGSLGVYLDTNYVSSYRQKDFPTVFKELGLYIYPYTLAESLAISNPSFYGTDSEIYKALTAAGRDWSNLVMEDNPDTLDVDETKVLEFAWGVYDQDSFLDTLACILDSILPLLQTLLSTKPFSEGVSQAAFAYSPKISLLVSVENVYLRGGLQLDIPALNVYGNYLVPLFEVLGIKDIPTLSADCSGDDVAQAIFGTLLKRVDEILNAPLSTILEILPNLVYYLSMDSIQELLDALTINLTLTIHEVEVEDYDGLFVGGLLDLLDGQLAGVISFDTGLVVADLINDQGGLYGLLGFELTNFNEIITGLIPMLGGLLGGEEGEEPAIDLSALTLPPIRQQDIIFCSDWVGDAGDQSPLVANKGDLLYWLLDYLVSALEDPAFMDMIMGLLGSSEEGGISGMIAPLIQKITSSFAGNPRGALAAIMEVLNPVTYDLKEMTWVESQWGYEGIDGLEPVDMIYLDYSNDWTEEKANYLVDNFDSLLNTILEMVEMDLGNAETLGAFLQSKINALFTNANITKLVEMLCGLGDSASAVIADVVTNQVGINIASWFKAFGYLFPADAWAEDAEIIKPTDKAYVNNFGIEGVANEDGTISWFFNRMPLVDGDGYTFVNILSRLLGEAQILIKFLFAGEDISAFADVVKLIGYETFESTLGMLMEAIGVAGVPSQAQFNADPMGSFTNTLIAILDWFYALTDAEDFASQLLELIPDLFYYIESNGLSVLLHNLLMPILVLVDTIRPLFDININQLLSIILSEFVSYRSLNVDTILQYVLNGVYTTPDDSEYVQINIDINNLRVSDILKIADALIGTNLFESNLVTYGITGFCSGVVDVTTDEGYAYKMTTVTAADAITILVTGLLESLAQPAQDPAKTNGDVLFAFLGNMTGKATIAGLYPVIAGILEGIEVTYTAPNWGYMLPATEDIFTVGNARETIGYLAYTTDWTEARAAAVYDKLDELLVSLVADFDGDVATLVNSLLEDKVYSDANLNMIIETIVNLFAGINASLFDLVDVILDTEIANWFGMCEEQTDAETGETKLVCTKDWGVDEATDKRATFLAALVEVLTPANTLLEWALCGNGLEFFIGSEKDADGNYTYNDVIAIAGSEGYDRAIVPIFRALGIALAPASSFNSAIEAVEAVLNSLFELIDSLADAESTVAAAMKLIPNLIYFLNADGFKSSINNLLDPINALLEKVGPILGDGKEISIGALLGDTLPIDITNITTNAVLALLTEKFGVQFATEDLDLGAILSTLYVGELTAYTYADGLTGYTLDVSDAEYDVLTLVLGFALDMFKINGELFSGLLGAEQYQAVLNLLAGATEKFEYADINWAYMYDGDLAQLESANGEFPERTGSAYTIYTQYQNNWNEATADYLNDVLDTLVQEIIKIAKDENTSIGKMLDDAISNGLYTNSILNSLIEAAVGALVEYEDIIVNAGVLLDAQGLATWFDDYCVIDAEGNVTVTKDWGIDSAATNEAKKAAFVEGFVEALQPAYRLLAWLLFEKDFEFLTDYAGAAHITIKGGKGYDEAFAPLFEALGAEMKPESAYTDADGNIDMENVVRDIFTAFTGILSSICGDLQNPGEKGALGTMFDLLPNVVYFINAGGVKAVVNNLLAPVNFILNELKAFGVSIDFATLIEGIDITNLDWYAVFDIVEDLVPLYFPEFTQEFLATLYMGKAEAYTSANGETAYRMVYTEEESRRDMITVVISFVGDAFVDARNKDQLVKWMGEDIYQILLTFLSGTAVSVEMQDFTWLSTEAGTKFSPITGRPSSGAASVPAGEGSIYDTVYGKYFTPEMGQYMEDTLPEFIDTVIELIGLEDADGDGVYENLEEILDSLIGETLYTKSNLEAIANALPGLIDMIKEAVGEELYGMIANVLNTALDIDLNYWNNYRVSDIEEGNRDQFVGELIRLLKPLHPILGWLLADEELIALFHSADGSGRDLIVVEGAEGYAYGIIPILEALGCDADSIRTPEEFKLVAESNQPENMLRLILNPLLDKVDIILADPVNELFEILPGVIFFMNSNGLDTIIKNIANAIFAVLENLEPAIGELDIYELIGFDPTTLNINTIIEEMLADLDEKTELEFKAAAIDAVGELTIGEVVEFTSKNGNTAYTMKYASEEDRTDMATVLIRFVLTIVTVEENARSIKLMLKDALDEDAYKFVCALLDNFVDMAQSADGMDKILYTIYYIYVGAKEGADGVDGALDDANNDYNFMKDLLENSDVPFLKDIAGTIGDFLDKNFNDIVDSEGIIPNGFIKFFQSLFALFEKIINWFKGFFN